LGKVTVLDPLVAQQVAAGEVVDRPASVVKELSENALDAGATRVEVEIADGGRERMVVGDNGSGMTQEDANLCVLSHATSKIRTASDIESVMTMGFRGEALPSIASVCAFSLITSTGQGAGTKVVTDGGGEATATPASHPNGTTVLVDRLFYNVPARRAFLKSARAERAAIVEVMTNLAIAHPLVMFRLTEKGRDLLSLPVAKDLLQRLAQLYGVGKARAMRPVDHESGAFKVSGYAALPSITEGSRSSQTVSVNGRWVRAEGLTKGIDDAYRGTVPEGLYPPVALRVEVDPHQVDVNVHPTKQLVRFSDEREARLAMSGAVSNAIQGTGEYVAEQDEQNTGSAPSATSSPHASEGDAAGAPTTAVPESYPTENRLASEKPSPVPSPERSAGNDEGGSISPHRLFEASENLRRSNPPKAPDLSEQHKYIEQDSTLPSRPDSSARVERGDLPRLRDLRVVGQIGSGYVLVDEPLAAWIVDQHVVHERALLDRLTDPEDGQMPTLQSLLIPEAVQLPPQDAAEAADSLEELSVYGFEVEPFGKDSFRIVIAEPDPFMREKLWPKLAQARVPVEISDADAQRLPFADESFDTVVSTLVICTIPDPQAALMEIRRVLRPAAGRLLFLEHVRGEGKVARWQDRVQPLWSWLLAGCHPNRDTVANVEVTGFRVEKLERFEPPVPLSAFAPCVQGAACVAEGGRE
jgi:DNA mismatch repair protein MutL